MLLPKGCGVLDCGTSITTGHLNSLVHYIASDHVFELKVNSNLFVEYVVLNFVVEWQ